MTRKFLESIGITQKDTINKILEEFSNHDAQLQNQIQQLQTLNSDQQKSHDAEINRLKLDYALDSALSAAGAKNLRAVKSLFDHSKLSLAPDGSVDGLAPQLDNLKNSDPYLFADKLTPSFKGLRPGESADLIPGSDVNASDMTYSQIAAYMNNSNI